MFYSVETKGLKLRALQPRIAMAVFIRGLRLRSWKEAAWKDLTTVYCAACAPSVKLRLK